MLKQHKTCTEEFTATNLSWDMSIAFVTYVTYYSAYFINE